MPEDAPGSSIWRQLAKSAASRALTVPVVAISGLLTTAIQVRVAGAETFALITLVSTLFLLLPFADLGLGAAVTTAFSQSPLDRAKSEATWGAAIRRLALVAAIGIALVWLVVALGKWNAILAVNLTPDGQFVIGCALSCFFVSLPLGIGQRALTGAGLNHLAATIPAISSLVALAYVWVISQLGSDPLWMSVGAPLGLLLANLAMTLAAWRLVLKPGGIRFNSPASARMHLAGSVSMLVINIGVPVSLQSGRLLLSHSSTLSEVASFSIMMQFYGIAWGLLTTAGLALWPVFVRSRSAQDQSLKTWRTMIWAFSGVASILGCGLAVLSPLVANALSAGKVVPGFGTSVSFGVMLLVQAAHLPAGMMLTTPTELRWQAFCVAAMCVATLGLAGVTAPYLGASSVPLAASIAVLSCQLIPDLLWAPRLLRRRDFGQ